MMENKMILPDDEKLVLIIHKMCDPKSFCAFRLVDRRMAFRGPEYIEAYQQTQLVPFAVVEHRMTLKYNTLCGKEHGVLTATDENGMISLIVHYQHGVVQGEGREYRSDGTLWSRQFYKNGKKYGKCKYFNTNGTISGYANYYRGKLHGKEKTFHQDGTISLCRNYRHGKLHGNYKMWDFDGSLLFDWVYVDGEEFYTI